MLFSGGLIPTYLVVRSVGCRATYSIGKILVNNENRHETDLVAFGEPENDLLLTLRENGIEYTRASSPEEAIHGAPDGAGVMILASGYPERTTHIAPELFAQARNREIRLYVEYPDDLPDLNVGEPRKHGSGEYGGNLDREVITSDAFGFPLKRKRIVMIHGCHYVPVEVDPSLRHIVVARVAGYDIVRFGLPDNDVWPILFEHPRDTLLVSSSKLSHFRSGRYAPTDAWSHVWCMILGWLRPGRSSVLLNWTPTVRPTYDRVEQLPADAEILAAKRGIEWYGRSGFFFDPSGKEGFYEGFSSKEMFADGSQLVSLVVRTDCHSEVGMALAMGSRVLDRQDLREISTNLNDLVYFKSLSARGPRIDPQSQSYGLVGFEGKADGGNATYGLIAESNERPLDNTGVYYGDDFARHTLGTIASSAILNSDSWDERMLMEILANFRTTGPWGFRKARLEEAEVQEKGWRYLWEESDGRWNNTPVIPHYQAYPWAVYLWLYDKTGFAPLLERTEMGIRNTMNALPDGWGSEGNRHETERCRMLLPLAWLLRVDDTAEHRQWLNEIVHYVLDAQHASGAIRHRIVEETTANEQYGTSECALIQSNGDPNTDLLYAVNFAVIGLHEAAAVTKDSEIRQAEDRLADFLTRIQIRSETRSELEGGWYRGFDFKRWDYWGSDGDIGWGVWTIETGWTVAWISSTLALRQMSTSLWDLSKESSIGRHMDKYRPVMLPDDVLDVPLRKLGE